MSIDKRLKKIEKAKAQERQTQGEDLAHYLEACKWLQENLMKKEYTEEMQVDNIEDYKKLSQMTLEERIKNVARIMEQV